MIIKVGMILINCVNEDIERFVFDICCIIEINEFDIVFVVENNIFVFDILMNDECFCMEEVDGLSYLYEYVLIF